MSIATHQNRKSGAQVTYLREWSGRAEFREGSKLRRMWNVKHMNENDALNVTIRNLLRGQ